MEVSLASLVTTIRKSGSLAVATVRDNVGSLVSAMMLSVINLLTDFAVSFKKVPPYSPDIQDKSQKAVDFRKSPDVWNTAVMFPQRGPARLDNASKLLGFIEEAKVSLQIVMFVASHPRFQSIVKQKYRDGIQVQVITNFDASPRGRLSSCVKQLMGMGIQVKAPQTTHHMHHKYIIIDGEAVLTGSLNWSKEGFTGNWENVLVTTNQRLVGPYVDNFSKLWESFKDVHELIAIKKQNQNREQRKEVYSCVR